MDTEKYSPQGCLDLFERICENNVSLTYSTEDLISSTFFHESC